MSDSADIETVGNTDASTPSIGRRIPAWLVTALGAVLTVILVVGIAFAWVMHDKTSSYTAQQRATSAAVAAAEQFALRIDTVDGAKFTAYTKSVNQLLTTKAQAKNAQQMAPLKQLYSKLKLTGTGKILLAGVSSSDSDSATVLVVHDQNVKSIQGTVTHHYRWTVSMDKVGGKWLVDNFTQAN